MDSDATEYLGGQTKDTDSLNTGEVLQAVLFLHRLILGVESGKLLADLNKTLNFLTDELVRIATEEED